MVDWRLSGRHQDEKMLFLSKNRILTQKTFSFWLIWSRALDSISFKLISSERSPYKKFISRKFSLHNVRLDFFRILQSRLPSQNSLNFVVFASFRHVTLIFSVFCVNFRNHRPKITPCTQFEASLRS